MVISIIIISELPALSKTVEESRQTPVYGVDLDLHLRWDSNLWSWRWSPGSMAMLKDWLCHFALVSMDSSTTWVKRDFSGRLWWSVITMMIMISKTHMISVSSRDANKLSILNWWCLRWLMSTCQSEWWHHQNADQLPGWGQAFQRLTKWKDWSMLEQKRMPSSDITRTLISIRP